MNIDQNQFLIGIDGNEANLVSERVGSNQFAYGLLKGLEKVDLVNKYTIYTSTKVLGDMPDHRAGWDYRVITPSKLWTQWRLPLDLYVHKPRPAVFLSLSHYIPRFSPVPRIVIITDLGFLKFPNQFLKKDLWQLKFWTSYSVKKADHIISISNFTKSDIVNHYNIPPSRISVVYPAYDDSIFYPRTNESVAKSTLAKYSIYSPYILFLGSLRPSKNLERLLEAFKYIKDDNLKLVLAGKKGWLYEGIFRKLVQLKLESRVIFTNFVDQKDLPYLLARAEVFVFPSLYEGFGMPLLEAMASGTPIVASDICSIPEVVGDAGILIDPLNVESITKGINIALSNKNELIKKGLMQAKKFDWEKSARSVMKILENFTN